MIRCLRDLNIKNLTKRGESYGYGKFAFANASLINTFFPVSRDKNGIKIEAEEYFELKFDEPESPEHQWYE